MTNVMRGSLKRNESHQKIKSDPPSAKSAIEQTQVAAAEFVITLRTSLRWYSIFLANSKSDDESGDEVKAQASH